MEIKLEVKNKSCWFKTWFDSNYYHILYKNRDTQEAQLFIDNLINHLKPNASSTFLDLGCGRGRHAIYLNHKKFTVTGVDLSPQNIEFAKQFENQTLHFFVHDMREQIEGQKFDFVLNLFTSFGYFDSQKEDEAAICAISDALNPNGIVVLDFFNANKVLNSTMQHHTKVIDNITFDISKTIKNNFVLKKIKIIDGNNTFTFEEKVKLISLQEFDNYFKKANLKIRALKGNYKLDDFDEMTSDRLIFIAQKNE